MKPAKALTVLGLFQFLAGPGLHALASASVGFKQAQSYPVGTTPSAVARLVMMETSASCSGRETLRSSLPQTSPPSKTAPIFWREISTAMAGPTCSWFVLVIQTSRTMAAQLFSWGTGMAHSEKDRLSLRARTLQPLRLLTYMAIIRWISYSQTGTTAQ